MKHLLSWFRRFASLFRRSETEQELLQEFESNLQLHIEDNIRAGMTPGQAQREARLKFGSIEAAKEAWRDQRGVPFLEQTWSDVKFALRQWRLSWGFTTMAVLTLTVGIGGITSVFAVIDRVVLNPLPYPDANRLVTSLEFSFNPALSTAQNQEHQDRAGGNDWRERNYVFEDMSNYWWTGFLTLVQAADAEIEGLKVLPNYFDVIGVKPAFGRSFSKDDGIVPRGVDLPPDGHAIVSHRFWQKYLGGDRNVLGREVQFFNGGIVVVGVMPAEFIAPSMPNTDFWVAYQPEGWRGGVAIGHLKPGISVAKAKHDMDALLRQIDREYGRRGNHYMILKPVTPIDSSDRALLQLMFGSGAALLLIAVSNLANLMVCRSVTREREFAIRSSLGSGRWRLVRQSMTESLVLSVAGGILGVVAAFWGLKLFAAGLPHLPRIQGASISFAVVGFLFVIVLLSSVAFGVAPALALSRLDPHTALKESAAQTSEGRRSRFFRQLLVAVQIALAAALLTGAVQTGVSFLNAVQADLNMETDSVFRTAFRLPQSVEENDTARRLFYENVIERLRAHPDVDAVALASGLPTLEGEVRAMQVTADSPVRAGPEGPFAAITHVTTDYFRTLRVSFLQGTSPPMGSRAVVINDSFARKYWPGADAVGKRLQLKDVAGTEWLIVAGVVRDLRSSFQSGRSMPGVFVTCQRHCDELLVKVRGNSASLGTAIRNAFVSFDPGVRVLKTQTMQDVVAESEVGSLREPRARTVLWSAFAGVGMLLALAGVYGVASYSAARRRREIGIRITLGATPASVIKSMMRQLSIPLGTGLIAGWIILKFLSGFLRRYGLLNGVRQNDVSYLVVGLILAVVVLYATLIAVRRNALADPISCLRDE